MLPLWVHSTGIALALLGRARGYEVELYLPDNVSTEKVDLLTTLGAKIKVRHSTTRNTRNTPAEHNTQHAMRIMHRLCRSCR
jgi:cysteine synthase